jgi:hypothetical protein
MRTVVGDAGSVRLKLAILSLAISRAIAAQACALSAR